MESNYNEEEPKISIDPNYISFKGKADSNSLTNKEYENNTIGNKKVILLQPVKKVEEENLKKENKMVIEKGNNSNKCNTVKEARKTLSPSITKTQKNIIILISKEEIEKTTKKNSQKKNEKGNEEQIKQKNPMTADQKRSEDENSDLDKMINSEFTIIPNINHNKERKDQKELEEFLNREKNQQNLSIKLTNYTFDINKELEKQYPYSFWNTYFIKYFKKNFLNFRKRTIEFFNDSAVEIYNMEKGYIPFKEQTITEFNYIRILESTIEDLICDGNDESCKKRLNELLEMEKNNKNKKIKILNIMASTTTKDMFLNYLKDRSYLTCKDCEFYLKKRFKTIEDDLIIYDDELNDRLIKFISSSSFSSNLSLIVEINKEEELYKCFKSNYTIRRKILLKCLESIHLELIENCKKYKAMLDKVCLKSQIGHGFEDYIKFVYKIIKDIYSFEKDAIDNVIELEENDILGDDTLFILFNFGKYIDFLREFLFCEEEKSQNVIKIRGEDGEVHEIQLKAFITYKACFNNEYSEDEKKCYKRDLIEILNGMKNKRAQSTSRKVTWENKMLGKKTNLNK